MFAIKENKISEESTAGTPLSQPGRVALPWRFVRVAEVPSATGSPHGRGEEAGLPLAVSYSNRAHSGTSPDAAGRRWTVILFAGIPSWRCCLTIPIPSNAFTDKALARCRGGIQSSSRQGPENAGRHTDFLLQSPLAPDQIAGHPCFFSVANESQPPAHCVPREPYLQGPERKGSDRMAKDEVA